MRWRKRTRKRRFSRAACWEHDLPASIVVATLSHGWNSLITHRLQVVKAPFITSPTGKASFVLWF